MYPFDFIIYILLIEWKILVAASTLLLSKLFKWFLLILCLTHFQILLLWHRYLKLKIQKCFHWTWKQIITVLNRILITHIYHSSQHKPSKTSFSSLWVSNLRSEELNGLEYQGERLTINCCLSLKTFMIIFFKCDVRRTFYTFKCLYRIFF